MNLTNPGRALGRSCLLSIYLKLLSLSGIPPFSTNSFRLAFLLALLVGLNFSFLIGALAWFIKIIKVVPFEVFRKGPFFSLSSSMIFQPLPSAALFTLTIWPFVSLPPRSPLRWRPHKERWSEYWCLPLNPSKCEAFFFSVDPHQANLFLLGSRLRFNPTPTFLGVTFDRTLTFSKHVSSLKAKFFPRLKALRCTYFLMEPLFLLYKAFLQPLLTYASRGWFPFLSGTNIIKLKHLHQAASRAITGCLPSSPIPLLLSEASLPPL